MLKSIIGNSKSMISSGLTQIQNDMHWPIAVNVTISVSRYTCCVVVTYTYSAYTVVRK